MERDHLGHGPAGPTDDDLLTVLYPIDDARQVRLGIMDVVNDGLRRHVYLLS
jgi:hypothetical protein